MKQLATSASRNFSSTMGQAHKLYNFTLSDINENLVNAEYAVRGLVPSRAEAIQTALVISSHAVS